MLQSNSFTPKAKEVLREVQKFLSLRYAFYQKWCEKENWKSLRFNYESQIFEAIPPNSWSYTTFPEEAKKEFNYNKVLLEYLWANIEAQAIFNKSLKYCLLSVAIIAILCKPSINYLLISISSPFEQYLLIIAFIIAMISLIGHCSLILYSLFWKYQLQNKFPQQYFKTEYSKLYDSYKESQSRIFKIGDDISNEVFKFCLKNYFVEENLDTDKALLITVVHSINSVKTSGIQQVSAWMTQVFTANAIYNIFYLCALVSTGAQY